MILSSENLFLLILGIIWIIFAVIQDFRKREVDNIWNFSLIAFVLAYRASVSAYSGNYWFLVNGILGLVIFLILGNLFYYARLFAGGDAKLVIALGTILSLDYNWLINFKIFGMFILLFLVTGSIYVLFWSFFLVFRNWNRFRKEFVKQCKNYKALFFIAIIFALLWILFSFIQPMLILIAIVIFLFPILFVFSKSVEESCMIKSTAPDKVTEGDWLYEDIIVNGKKISANWEGVSNEELKSIKKYYRRKILIKKGIPFTHSFLFAFVGIIIIAWNFGFQLMDHLRHL